MQEINIGDVLVIITIVSAEQVYNGKVNLFNKIEPFRSLVRFPFHSGMSHAAVIKKELCPYFEGMLNVKISHIFLSKDTLLTTSLTHNGIHYTVLHGNDGSFSVK